MHKDDPSSNPSRRITRMKKLLIIALGLGIALGSVSFAQDDKKDEKKSEKKKKGKKDKDAPPPEDKK
jgi:hypothetical protein